MRSLMPCTAFSSTVVGARKASTIEICAPASARSGCWGSTIRVSTLASRRLMPESAFLPRRLPSKPKGLVTTPTVRAPQSRATWAMTGAAPVPVPPPMPAVTKTMSAPEIASAMRWISSAALLADLGVGAGAEALGQGAAELHLVGREVASSAWRSVLAATNSTPSRPLADHGVDGVAATTADADDQDLGVVDVVEVDEGHVISPVW
jgi:hypothetical protein